MVMSLQVQRMPFTKPIKFSSPNLLTLVGLHKYLTNALTFNRIRSTRYTKFPEFYTFKRLGL